MKLRMTIALFLTLAPALVLSQGKPKKTYKVPAVFNQARYVYVEALDGQEFDPRLDPVDRNAIIDVEKALNDWNRYVQTTRRDQADLIFVVRKGRLATGEVDARMGSGTPGFTGRPAGGQGSGPGVAVGGEVGPPDDLLEVFLPGPNDPRGTKLWERTLPDGLDPPELTLFRELKDEVERAYPSQTASKAQKP
jgi:hypothetical protein